MSAPSAFNGLEARRRLEEIKRVILVGSGKGGVGKSFIACGLALSLQRAGHRVGLLDLDIHGASVPGYLRLTPPVSSSERGLEPKVADGVKVTSVALFTGSNPVPLRGELKDDFVTQLLALTNWGALDYLVVDLPPSTGDELLSSFRLFYGRCLLVLVTTPSQTALSVVSRLKRLADRERVPIEGVIVNMAFMRVGGRRAYPFGRLGPEAVRRSLGSELLAEFPLEPALNSRTLSSLLRGRGELATSFRRLAKRVTG